MFVIISKTYLNLFYYYHQVNTHPVVEKEGDVDGMYVLRDLPDGTKTFSPQPFIKDSRKDLVKLVALTSQQIWGRSRSAG